jgi:hypothetical protein
MPEFESLFQKKTRLNVVIFGAESVSLLLYHTHASHHHGEDKSAHYL